VKDLAMSSMLDLFRQEVQIQVQALTAGLLALEREEAAAEALQTCMRAAHSLKGAARIVGIDSVVGVAHAMEDGFVSAQQQQRRLGRAQVDVLLQGVDLLDRVGKLPEADLVAWANPEQPQALAWRDVLSAALEEAAGEAEVPAAQPPVAVVASDSPATDRVLRLTADSVNRLLGLASESLVASRGLKPVAAGALRLRRRLTGAQRRLAALRQTLSPAASDPGQRQQRLLDELQEVFAECQASVARQEAQLALLDRRASDLSRRLYDEALACRMRPFGDALHGLPRLVRDLARSLGKRATLVLAGENTPVDRELLERLEAPLMHLLRNAVDHGIEAPDARRAAGKPEEGVVTLEARHVGGLLQITVSDDGDGIRLDALRARIVRRRLAPEDTAARLSEAELLEFLFLPGFSLRDAVTEVSGRGVGLDVVQDMVRQVRGQVRVSTQPGHGTRMQMLLPLTLSVIRALLVEVGGEAYAFPLNRIARALSLSHGELEQVEGRPHFELDGHRIGLVAARQLLHDEPATLDGRQLTVVVIGEPPHACGLLVERALDERELVAQPLDERLGKVQHVSAGAVADDGSVVLILDVADLMRAVERHAAGGGLGAIAGAAGAAAERPRKRVLVVDDSLAVRELERKLLDARGYRVDVAVDGMDGWNAVRNGRFDLVVTDVDMPRLDGIELVRLIRHDPHLKHLPVMIVSYKDREADRQRGLDAGADHYLAKSGFHDEALLQAVAELIGEAA
jgi:two-component system, chemotaxis family, sensor histidine kinase and response regulator WspE